MEMSLSKFREMAPGKSGLHARGEGALRQTQRSPEGPRHLHSARLPCPWNSPGKNTGVGCHALLQGMFPIEGLNCRQILYHLCLKADIKTIFPTANFPI